MPRKIRDLVRDLTQAGFVNRGGKGAHRNFEHKEAFESLCRGQLSDDAKPYQEREVKLGIEESKQ
jgi:hypothetical protein